MDEKINRAEAERVLSALGERRPDWIGRDCATRRTRRERLRRLAVRIARETAALSGREQW